MKEVELQANVEALIRTLHLLGYHTYDSRRSQPGFPDLVVVGRRGVLYRELKTRAGVVSPSQQRWLTALRAAGEDADVWRPDDWPVRITRELRALGSWPSLATLTQAEARRKVAARGRK